MIHVSRPLQIRCTPRPCRRYLPTRRSRPPTARMRRRVATASARLGQYACNVPPVQANSTQHDSRPTGQDREEGALARPVDPEQPEALSLGDAQRGGLDGDLGPEGGRVHLAHTLDLDVGVSGQHQARFDDIAQAARGQQQQRTLCSDSTAREHSLGPGLYGDDVGIKSVVEWAERVAVRWVTRPTTSLVLYLSRGDEDCEEGSRVTAKPR